MFEKERKLYPHNDLEFPFPGALLNSLCSDGSWARLLSVMWMHRRVVWRVILHDLASDCLLLHMMAWLLTKWLANSCSAHTLLTILCADDIIHSYLVYMLVPPSLQSNDKHLGLHIYHHSCTWVCILLYTCTSIQMVACMIITCITLTFLASLSTPIWLALTHIWAYTTSMITTVTITLCYETIIAEHCDAQNTDNTFLAVLSFPSFNTLTVIWSHTGSPIHASRRTVS